MRDLPHRNIARRGFAYMKETRLVVHLSQPAARIVRRMSRTGRCDAPS
ncbi:hypothetical protein BLA14095_02559 [Burkholderia lata]|nr:hypothetical protein BLA14095_02559 [Burkholderia lata]